MTDQRNAKQSIQDWWAENPMTYGHEHGTTHYVVEGEHQEIKFGSREFFQRADIRFTDWNTSLHSSDIPFGKIFDYQKYQGSPVLEIGCGMGFMAMNWGISGAKIVAADYNPVAVQQTRQRFKVFDVPGEVVQLDGEQLPFARNNFAYVYSWGVLHHTPGIVRAIQEIYAVLQPGGRFGMMLYNRASFRARYLLDYVEGFLHLENEFLSPLELHSRYGDGAGKEGNPHTWPVTHAEVYEDLMPQFENIKIKVLGTEIGNVLDFFFPGLGKFIMPLGMKKAIARRWGWSLWIEGEKTK